MNWKDKRVWVTGGDPFIKLGLPDARVRATDI